MLKRLDIHISKTRPNHKFPSYKNNKTIAARNSLILDYCYYLEYDRNVISYSGNADKIFYETNGFYKALTADFIVQRQSSAQALYIDRAGILSDSEVSKISTVYLRENTEFRRLFTLNIRREPLISNIKLLYRYARQIPSLHDQLAVFQFFKTRNAAKLKDLRLFFRDKRLNETIPYSLLFHHFLETDLNKPLNDDSIVRPKN